MNFRFPVFLDLSGKKCLVTGEGNEVPLKVQALVDASANVTYVNPRADSQIQILASAGLIDWKPRGFKADDLTDCFLAITDHDDNSEIFQLAEEQRVLCNAVDDPQNCRFSFGSVHRQGDLTIAISTNGWAPAVAVRLRERLQVEVGPEYGVLLALLKDVRQQIAERIPEFSARRDLWYRIVDSEVLALLRQGRTEEASIEIHEMIEDAVLSVILAEHAGSNVRH